MSVLSVHLTFDIEVWPLSWIDPVGTFEAGFNRNILGRSSAGNFGLPKALEIMAHQNIKGIFFVEPLFSLFAGRAHLVKVVELIQAAGHSIQLHLHPEWLSVIQHKDLPRTPKRFSFLSELPLHEQEVVIRVAKDLLESCTRRPVEAFRAGSFGACLSTLEALRRNGIYIDYSANECLNTTDALAKRVNNCDRVRIGGVTEYPVSHFIDGTGRRRHAQVAAAGVGEFTSHMKQARTRGQGNYVIVSHGKELLKPDSDRPSRLLVRRFERLCKFLGENRSAYPTVADPMQSPHSEDSSQAPSIAVPGHSTMGRMAEQVACRYI